MGNATPVNTSKELMDLVQAMIEKAYEEGLTVTELNMVISNCRKEMGLCKKNQKYKSAYRNPTIEEIKFRENVCNFLLDEVSFEEATTYETRQQGQIISTPAYISRLSFYSEIMCAAKMLLNDNQKITIANICNIIWTSEKYTNQQDLSSRISFSIKRMREIAFCKRNNGSWKSYNIDTRTTSLVNSYFEILKDHNIQ